MKILSFLFFLIILPQLSIGQNQYLLHINYKVTDEQHKGKLALQVWADHHSVLSVLSETYPICYENGDKHEYTNKFHVYKDFDSGKMISEQYLPNSALMCVEEPTNLCNWTICDSIKEILGYRCQKAVTTFRGRNYTAWFTTEIAARAMPWKFDALPGVTLHVYSDDKFLDYKAIKLNLKSGMADGIDKEYFANKKTISWEKYLELYRKKFKERNSAFSSQMAIMGVNAQIFKALAQKEVIVEENRLTGADVQKAFETSRQP